MFQAIPEGLILQVDKQDTLKGIWDRIKSRNLGAYHVNEARLQTLRSNFERIKTKDSKTIDSVAEKLSELASKYASLGQAIEESKLVRNFLNSLPKKIHIISSLE